MGDGWPARAKANILALAVVPSQTKLLGAAGEYHVMAELLRQASLRPSHREAPRTQTFCQVVIMGRSMRITRALMLIGLGLVVIFGVAVASDRFQACIVDQAGHHPNTTNGQAQAGHVIVVASSARVAVWRLWTYVRCLAHAFNAYAALLTFLASVFIAAFTATLWRATNHLWQSSENQRAAIDRSSHAAERAADAATEANKLTKVSLVTVQRAFVWSPGMHMDIVLAATGEAIIRMRIEWQNSGTTPARHLELSMGATDGTVTQPLPRDYVFRYTDDKAIPMLLAPKGTTFTHAASLTVADMLTIQSGTRIQYFWGRATYNDIFDDTPTRITCCCYRVYEVIGDPRHAATNGLHVRWAIHDRYNCADDDCKET